ncbi:MAG TPA: MraY family glycosyltransferase [Phycisphaerae bacterium]|nr:MraY family glycosyltransferase [Phycisphaerae bacterium]HQA00637.1 MraY family glycosyltransferase [Phycisphaerae bacterium]HQE29132.1 MraY family glycosyltransferase [Phycisphaerae bacterium]
MMILGSQEALRTPRPLVEFLFELWPVALLSFVVVLVMTPVCRWFATKYRIVDRPDDFLKPHKRPIPYLGGVAIFTGWAAGIVIGMVLGWFPVRWYFLGGILAAGLGIMIVGLLDDLRNMTPRIKLACNLAVGLLLIGVGVGRNSFHILVRASVAAWDTDPSLQWLELLFSVPLTLFIIVGACNATNLIDGMDGMCSGVLGIISLGFFVLALHMASYGTGNPLDYERLVLTLAMLGAAMGFLPYNMNPASIFMGDAGSMLLGLNAAVLILLFAEPGLIKWMLGAVMVFGLPVADMVLTLLRRWRNARPLMLGDRSHFYDQLTDRGFSVRQVVAISYALSIGFAVIGCGTAIFLRTRYMIPVIAGVFLVTAIAISKFGMVSLMPPEQRGSGTGPARDHHGHNAADRAETPAAERDSASAP